MAKCPEVNIRIVLTNKKDLERIMMVRSMLEELYEDMPWKDELKEAAEILGKVDLDIVPEKLLELWSRGSLVKFSE